MSHPPKPLHVTRNPLRTRPWFDSHGWFQGELPAECIADCSRAGAVDNAVEFWRVRLGFWVPRELAIAYLSDFGAWPMESDAYDVGLLETDDDTLASRVLWIACCDLRESGEWLGLVH